MCSLYLHQPVGVGESGVYSVGEVEGECRVWVRESVECG